MSSSRLLPQLPAQHVSIWLCRWVVDQLPHGCCLLEACAAAVASVCHGSSCAHNVSSFHTGNTVWAVMVAVAWVCTAQSCCAGQHSSQCLVQHTAVHACGPVQAACLS